MISRLVIGRGRNRVTMELPIDEKGRDEATKALSLILINMGILKLKKAA